MNPLHPDDGEQFLLRERCRHEPTIVAALLGGSQIYRDPGSERLPHSSDWDGALLLARKLEIYVLVNEHRQALIEMFDIVHEECPHLRVPDPSSEIWDDFDAVRFVGFTKAGSRKSVKIMSQDYFSGSKTALNILSFKDKRVFECSTSQATLYYRIHQATRLEDDLYILHDQWVFKSGPSFCAHGNDISPTSFGITADLLVSGMWLFGETSCGQLILKRLLQQYAAASNRHATVESLARFSRFSPSHRQWLADRLASLNVSIVLPSYCGCVYTRDCVVYGSTTSIHSKLPSQRSSRVRCLPPDLALSCNTDNLPSRPIDTLPFFTSNSINKVIIIPVDSVEDSAIKVFCKRSKYQEQEVRGAQEAALFYPQVQISSISRSGHLLYPLFEGRTEAEHRLDFIRSGRSNLHHFEVILTTELNKAEDMLRAYRQSFQNPVQEGSSVGQPIHRFYHSRLVNNTRFGELYSTGIDIHGHLLPMASFLCMQIEVNGVTYPSFEEISRKATGILHPMAKCSCPNVFGLGDAHGANIMIHNEEGPNHRRELLYIDYEVAGYHSVMLDLAKPIYLDVFFEMLYADNLEDPPEIEYVLEDGVIKVTLSACTDRLGQEIFNIKRRFLIDPLVQYSQSLGCSLVEHVPQLAYALFSCACLTRDFRGEWDSLFRNIAVGVVLSQAADLDELWACFHSFGF